MIVNHQRRFIFYHVPKTAGSSIHQALLRDPGSIEIVRPTKHLTPPQYLKTVASEIAEAVRGYASFCFVRDPWERFGSVHRFLLSQPKHVHRVPESLDDFVAALAEHGRSLRPRRSTRPQSDIARNVAFIGRYENLDGDFRRIAKSIGLPWRFWKRLEHRNSSGDPVSYRRLMNARSQAIIADFYREDIERFGYR